MATERERNEEKLIIIKKRLSKLMFNLPVNGLNFHQMRINIVLEAFKMLNLLLNCINV